MTIQFEDGDSDQALIQAQKDAQMRRAGLPPAWSAAVQSCSCTCAECELARRATPAQLHEAARLERIAQERAREAALSACGSVAEEALLVELFDGEQGRWRMLLRAVEQQWEVKTHAGDFRLDFAWPSIKLAVEIDGFNFHGRTRESFVHDRRRDRALCALGWKVLRFAASEVLSNPSACVRDIAAWFNP